MSEKTYWGAAAVLTAGVFYLGTWYQPVLTTFHILVCLLLVLVVLLQSGRAADLAGAFGGSGSQTAFGPRGAATLLSRATTFLAIVFMVSSLVLAVYASRPRSSVALPTSGQETEEAAPVGEDTAPSEAPPAEAPAPAQE
jgi:preprotein translocase subunit SecG